MNDSPRKSFLFQLSTTELSLPGGQRLDLVLPCYLVETQTGRKILIDSGYPADVPMPTGVPPAQNQKNVLEHLGDINLAPSDVDTVICTHFDVDHAGYHDAFPHAEFIVQREHYTVAREGHPRCAAARSHWDRPELRYRFVDGDQELRPGLDVIETGGHVPGHQSVLVRLPQTGLILLAIDAVMLGSGIHGRSQSGTQRSG